MEWALQANSVCKHYWLTAIDDRDYMHRRRDGMSLEARASSAQDNSALALAKQQQAEPRVTRLGSNTASECSLLNAQISSIDAASRQPQARAG